MIHIYDADRDSRRSVPIGVPSDNVAVYLLDAHLKPVPMQVKGEIYISGHGVARGYLNRPELTKERFLDNPFVPGERMYKTGDMGIRLENGLIEYLGRNDNQVKIRGFRIELGEIEGALSSYPDIQHAVVNVVETGDANRLFTCLSSPLYGTKPHTPAGNHPAYIQWQGGQAKASCTRRVLWIN
jgi:acyl-coenzyme A synthetase/AMP-(fatty) acid ligase